MLLALIFWNWMQSTRLTRGYLKTALRWNMLGNVFLFSAVWFECGIGAGPGNLLTNDPAMHSPLPATVSAALGMLASVAGWFCLLLGQRTIVVGAAAEQARRHPATGAGSVPIHA